MANDLHTNSEYLKWVSGLKEKIRVSQLKAALKVNAELLSLYWQLGEAIVEKQSKSDWGDKIITQLSKDLNAEFKEISGFSRSNLFNIRKWYLFYARDIQLVQQGVGLIAETNLTEQSEIVQQSVGQLPAILTTIPWGHQVQIVTKSKTIQEALYYVQQTTVHNWKRSVLEYHLDSDLFLRKGQAQNNFELVLPKPQSELAADLLKKPYNLDFLSLGEAATERDLENAIIANIKNFLLELGTGFAFVGQQYAIQVGEKDFRIDLLFYHTRLHLYFVVELKVTEFEPEYAGKLEFYVEAIDKQLKTPGDNPSIGLLLCKSVDKIIVEYTLNTRTKPIGVAEYKHTNQLPKELADALPDAESLKHELLKEIVLPKNPINEKIEKLQQLIKTLNADEAIVETTPAVTREIFT